MRTDFLQFAVEPKIPPACPASPRTARCAAKIVSATKGTEFTKALCSFVFSVAKNSTRMSRRSRKSRRSSHGALRRKDCFSHKGHRVHKGFVFLCVLCGFKIDLPASPISGRASPKAAAGKDHGLARLPESNVVGAAADAPVTAASKPPSMVHFDMPAGRQPCVQPWHHVIFFGTRSSL